MREHNQAVRTALVDDVDTLKSRLYGQERRICDLISENKNLKKKIHGQRAAIRSLGEENEMLKSALRPVLECDTVKFAYSPAVMRKSIREAQIIYNDGIKHEVL